jgi:hypothetical protein
MIPMTMAFISTFRERIEYNKLFVELLFCFVLVQKPTKEVKILLEKQYEKDKWM